MNKLEDNEIERNQVLNQICVFFRFNKPNLRSENIKEAIKEICVARLCKAIGLSSYNSKSDFFDFFSSIMGEAVCEELSINIRIASDELRLVKYNHVNLVKEVKRFLETETIEEAFLDAFDLIDDFKYLIPYLKKTS